MQLTADNIYNLYVERRNRLQKVHAAGARLERAYNGELEVILPELDRNEISAVANLIQVGIDQHAQRISSVMPNPMCPPLKVTKSEQKRADQMRLAILAWWHVNRMTLKMPRRARHLIGYGSSPVYIHPCSEGYPEWEVKAPLETFPAPCAPDDLVPQDCIFSFQRSLKWLNERYPDFRIDDKKRDTLVTVLQFISAEQITLVACTTPENMTSYGPSPEIGKYQLSSVENRAGRPLVVIPGRITLERLAGQFDQLIGMHQAQAKLWALQIHAVQREIFGETWITSHPNSTNEAAIIQPADPYDGTVGIVQDGSIQQFRVVSSQGPNQAIDRLERNQRVTGAIPAEMGGEGAGNVRTGRRGQQVFSASVDFPVKEHQELLAASLEEENKIAMEIAKAYWGDTPRTFQVPYTKGPVTYTPNITFATTEHTVTQAYAGADTNGLVIEGGQRLAQKSMSLKTFMAIDPMITDPDSEHDEIIKEGIEQAFLTSIQTQAADPAGPWQPLDLARLTELIYTGDLELYEAVQKVHAEAQATQQQSAEGQLPPEQGQPGLAMAGAPGTPQAAISGPNPNQQNLAGLLNSLRRPNAGPYGTGG